MNTNPKLSSVVMRRVRTIHTLRTYGAPVSAVAVFVFALWGIGREVWVAKVFENLATLADVPSIMRYLAGAFVHTDLLVQILSILVVAALVWLASEVAHLLKSEHRLA